MAVPLLNLAASWNTSGQPQRGHMFMLAWVKRCSPPRHAWDEDDKLPIAEERCSAACTSLSTLLSTFVSVSLSWKAWVSDEANEHLRSYSRAWRGSTVLMWTLGHISTVVHWGRPQSNDDDVTSYLIWWCLELVKYVVCTPTT
jgi:hypothetical protein